MQCSVQCNASKYKIILHNWPIDCAGDSDLCPATSIPSAEIWMPEDTAAQWAFSEVLWVVLAAVCGTPSPSRGRTGPSRATRRGASSSSRRTGADWGGPRRSVITWPMRQTCKRWLTMFGMNSTILGEGTNCQIVELPTRAFVEKQWRHYCKIWTSTDVPYLPDSPDRSDLAAGASGWGCIKLSVRGLPFW